MNDTKTQILKAAAPKPPTPRKPVPATPAIVASAPVPAPAPAPAVVASAFEPADQAKIDATAEQQRAHIKANLLNARMSRAAQEAVEAKLKAEGIDLEAINADHLAQQHLADLETSAAEKAAKAKALELYKAKYGVDFAE